MFDKFRQHDNTWTVDLFLNLESLLVFSEKKGASIETKTTAPNNSSNPNNLKI